jgi:hypothetical protein
LREQNLLRRSNAAAASRGSSRRVVKWLNPGWFEKIEVKNVDQLRGFNYLLYAPRGVHESEMHPLGTRPRQQLEKQAQTAGVDGIDQTQVDDHRFLVCLREYRLAQEPGLVAGYDATAAPQSGGFSHGLNSYVEHRFS